MIFIISRSGHGWSLPCFAVAQAVKGDVGGAFACDTAASLDPTSSRPSFLDDRLKCHPERRDKFCCWIFPSVVRSARYPCQMLTRSSRFSIPLLTTNAEHILHTRSTGLNSWTRPNIASFELHSTQPAMRERISTVASRTSPV